MPSSATITAFYNFTANTKARASQVQNNFDVFRGHLLPLSPTTATASDNTYDLGSSEYRWRNGFFETAYLGLTTTSWSVSDSTTTNDYINFKQNGSTKFAISKNCAATSSASIGQIALSQTTLSAYYLVGGTSTSSAISGSTLTITTIGRPVHLSLVNMLDSSIGGFVYCINPTSGAAVDSEANLIFRRNGTPFAQQACFFTMINTGASTLVVGYPCGAFNAYDFPAAGTYNYDIYMYVTSGKRWALGAVRLLAFEI